MKSLMCRVTILFVMSIASLAFALGDIGTSGTVDMDFLVQKAAKLSGKIKRKENFIIETETILKEIEEENTKKVKYQEAFRKGIPVEGEEGNCFCHDPERGIEMQETVIAALQEKLKEYRDLEDLRREVYIHTEELNDIKRFLSSEGKKKLLEHELQVAKDKIDEDLREFDKITSHRYINGGIVAGLEIAALGLFGLVGGIGKANQHLGPSPVLTVVLIGDVVFIVASGIYAWVSDSNYAEKLAELRTQLEDNRKKLEIMEETLYPISNASTED